MSSSTPNSVIKDVIFCWRLSDKISNGGPE